MGWFDGSTEGLRQLVENKGKAFMVREMVQNAWDEPGVTHCAVILERVPGTRGARLVVEDDAPEGFYDLRHVYTLFAPTRKRSSPTKRGRFDFGEKEVISMCSRAKVTTTKGTVEFLPGDKRRETGESRNSGSIFEGIVRMTLAEIEDCARAMRTFIPPAGIRTTFNGRELPGRSPLATVEATLATEFEDKKKRYRPTKRKTSILVYEPLPGEKAMIYEMGLPIIETGDRWHYDIQQRIPLSMDRDSVSHAFLQDVRAEILNVMASCLTQEDAGDLWVRDASADDRIKPETLNTIAEFRWGEKRTVAAPGDSYGKEKALAAGFHLVASREMSAAEWEQMRKAGCVPSASSLFPQPPASAKAILSTRWTDAQKQVVALAKRVARLTLGIDIKAKIISSPDTPTSADYEQARKILRFNVARLGKNWFTGPTEDILHLIVHELGHELGGHISEAYYEGLARIGAKLALCDPEDLLNGKEAG